MALYSGEPIIGRIFASEIWGACFREGLGLIIGILQYIIKQQPPRSSSFTSDAVEVRGQF